MGCDVKAQLNEESEFLDAVCILSEASFKRVVFPWYRNDLLFSFTSLGKKYQNAFNFTRGFTSKVIQERKAVFASEKHQDKPESIYGIKKRYAFLDLMLECSRSNGNIFSDKDIEDEVITFLFAGHDTVSAALCWCLYYLGLYPEIQEKVHEEIDNVIGDSEDHISSTQLGQLKFLECVIKETLRLRPVAPLYGRQLKEELQVGEYLIPAGVDCFVVPYLLHRDPTYFPNPEKFDPERFEAHNSAGRHPYAYVPFSKGPRNCIGQRFAGQEMKIVLAHVLRKFIITTLCEKNCQKAFVEIVMRPTDEMLMRIERRR